MLGNNAKSSKFKRVYVPLTRDNTLTSPFGGRYYFPEDPELERKTITGIQIHLGGAGVGDISQDNSKILLGTISENIIEVNPLNKVSFLTLYADDGSEKLSNFPIYGLFNQNIGRQIQRITIGPFKDISRRRYGRISL
jgi:hypothetical protein